MSFREGNAAPAAGNLEFHAGLRSNMPKGRQIKAVRADSAAYQAAIFNWCEDTGKVFAIGADQDTAVKAAIRAIPESGWKPYQDGQVAETVHCMNKTKKAFGLSSSAARSRRTCSRKSRADIAITLLPATAWAKPPPKRCNGIASAATPARTASRI